MIRFFLCIFYPIAIFANMIPITIETADTDEERAWGLMGRDWLPEDHGMLFIYDNQTQRSVWMFNTLIDLSVAFINSNGVITEIKQLKAYPEMMDPDRPVLSLKDLWQYPPGDPIVLFFRRKRVTSTQKARYVLEMQKDWFKEHDVKPGDRLLWKPGETRAMIQLQKRTESSMFLPRLAKMQKSGI